MIPHVYTYRTQKAAHAVNRPVAVESLTQVVEALVALCECSHQEVAASSAQGLDIVLASSLDSDLFDDANESGIKILSQVRKKLVATYLVKLSLMLAFNLQVLRALSVLLEYRFQQNWHIIFPVIGRIFGYVEQSYLYFLSPLLEGLVLLHDALEGAPAAASSGTIQLIEATVGEIVATAGPETFLRHISLGDVGAAEVILPSRVWCLKILRENAREVKCSLCHFHDCILPMVHALEQKLSSTAEMSTATKIIHLRIAQLWALLPAYCINPCDLLEGLPLLEPPLSRAIKNMRTPELLHVICRALQNLVGFQIIVDTANGSTSSSVTSLRTWSSGERSVLERLAKSIMPALFKVVDGGVSPNTAQPILDALSALSSVASSVLIDVLFKKLLQKLLELTLAAGTTSEFEKNNHDRAVVMCELAIALVPNLTEPSIALLYDAIKPMMTMDTNPAFQKRCYKILLSVCNHHAQFSLGEERLMELLQLLTASLLTCHVSSRQMRLRCLICIVKGFDAANSLHMEAIPKLTGEVILCTKDSNAKAREAAHELLLTMADRFVSIRRFVDVVTAALAAKTPHMRSAAILSLTYIIAKCASKDAELHDLIPELLATILMLLHEQAREVVKAVIAFTRVAIAACSADRVAPIVPQIVDGLMKWAGDTKNRFRAQIKLVMKKLCRLYGFEYIAGLLPQSDQPLIAYLQKMANRSRRNRNEKDQSSTLSVSGSKFDGMGDSDDSGTEDDDELTFDGYGSDHYDEEDEDAHVLTGSDSFSGLGGGGDPEGRSARISQSEMMVQDHGNNGSVVDLLDSSLIHHMRVKSRSAPEYHQDDRDEDEMNGGVANVYYAPDGRMIVPDESDRANKKTLLREDISGSSSKLQETKDTSRKEGKRKRDGRAAEREIIAPNRQQHKKVKTKRAAGHEYKSKKGAGGDLRKTGMLEPYAYIPLDGKALSGKKNKGALDDYAEVVKNTNAKGSKGRSKRHTKRR